MPFPSGIITFFLSPPPSAGSTPVLRRGAHHQELPCHRPRRTSQRPAGGGTHRRPVPGRHVHSAAAGHAHSHQQPPADAGHRQCVKFRSAGAKHAFMFGTGSGSVFLTPRVACLQCPTSIYMPPYLLNVHASITWISCDTCEDTVFIYISPLWSVLRTRFGCPHAVYFFWFASGISDGL